MHSSPQRSGIAVPRWSIGRAILIVIEQLFIDKNVLEEKKKNDLLDYEGKSSNLRKP